LVPTEAPTEAPAPAPTPTPVSEPVTRVVVVQAASDTSVSLAAPDAPQPADQVAILPAGGTVGAVALMTFSVEGIGAGTVVEAKLVLTGAGDIGGVGGVIGMAPGYWVDEATLIYNEAPVAGLPAAVRADGSAATLDWIEPWTEVAVDVTGSVTTDGTMTFVVTGTAEQAIALASRESGAPAYLQITVVE
jgi:hypothetical protein